MMTKIISFSVFLSVFSLFSFISLSLTSAATVGMGYNSLDNWEKGVTNGRIWDMGATWKDIHTGVDTYDWSKLDAIIGQMESFGMSITYVIAGCPQWLAKYPDQPYYAPWLGPGSNSMPYDMDEANKFFWNLSTRYANRIHAYEIWNEPQLADFLYPYEPAELNALATMTKRAYSTIKTCDPNARIVAASVLPRQSSGGMQKAEKYLSALAQQGWNVDIMNCHIYPEIGKQPADWGAMLSDCRQSLQTMGAPTSEVWVTETNYDILGAVIPEASAATYVDGTYQEAGNQGVTEVYWYGWDTTSSLGGLDIRSGTAAWNEIVSHGQQSSLKIEMKKNATNETLWKN